MPFLLFIHNARGAIPRTEEGLAMNCDLLFFPQLRYANGRDERRCAGCEKWLPVSRGNWRVEIGLYACSDRCSRRITKKVRIFFRLGFYGQLSFFYHENGK